MPLQGKKSPNLLFYRHLAPNWAMVNEGVVIIQENADRIKDYTPTGHKYIFGSCYRHLASNEASDGRYSNDKNNAEFSY